MAIVHLIIAIGVLIAGWGTIGVGWCIEESDDLRYECPQHWLDGGFQIFRVHRTEDDAKDFWRSWNQPENIDELMFITPTAIATPVVQYTSTPVIQTPSATLTMPPPTQTPTQTSVATVESLTATATAPTISPTLTPTPTIMATRISRPSSTMTATSQATLTATPTQTPEKTATPAIVATQTPTASPTQVAPTATATAVIPSPAPTKTPIPDLIEGQWCLHCNGELTGGYQFHDRSTYFYMESLCWADAGADCICVAEDFDGNPLD